MTDRRIDDRPGVNAGLSFRRAGPEDAAAVRSLTRAAYAKWVPLIGREPIPMAADYDRAVQKHRIELAFAKNQLAGLVELIEAPDHWMIENLAVDPALQSAGLGGALLAHAEDCVRRQGVGLVRLYTNALFAANISFYLKRGYCETSRESFKGGTLVHMAKNLK